METMCHYITRLNMRTFISALQNVWRGSEQGSNERGIGYECHINIYKTHVALWVILMVPVMYLQAARLKPVIGGV